MFPRILLRLFTLVISEGTRPLWPSPRIKSVAYRNRALLRGSIAVKIDQSERIKVSDNRALERGDRARMPIRRRLFHVEKKRRRSKLIKVLGIKCHIKSTVVNAEAIFTKPELGKGNYGGTLSRKNMGRSDKLRNALSHKNQSSTNLFG